MRLYRPCIRPLISIHALREEGDVYLPDQHFYCVQFLSTPSARRATCSHGCRYCFAQFLSTPSARRATVEVKNKWDNDVISIHALREEGDNPTATYESIAYNFYPRPPRGGRLQCVINRVQFFQFLSTPSARRATSDVVLPSLSS